MGVEQRIKLDLGPRSYDIVVGAGILARAGQLMWPLLKSARVAVVSDMVVAPLHLPLLGQALRAAAIDWEPFLIPPGEATKSFAHLENLCRRLLAWGLDRDTLLVALGGGVVGDLVGFAAAILLRGLDFVQVPTTLLAQVDSAVGGKTGINTPEGKNLVGNFHQPRLVLADTALLASLPRRELLAGYAEVVKYGLIDAPDFFAWLERNAHPLLAGDPAALTHAVLTSCRAKARIVGADERESAQRLLLNLGHTFAHALEVEGGYDGRVLHGEAVAVGLALAFDLSVRCGFAAAEDALHVHRHLRMVGLPTALAQITAVHWEPARLIAHMRRDKKASGARLTFVLARGIGRAFVSHDISLDALRLLLLDSMAGARPSSAAMVQFGDHQPAAGPVQGRSGKEARTRAENAE